MREGKGFAGLQMLRDLFFVNFGLGFVRREDHDDVAPCSCVGNGSDFEAHFLCLIDGLAGSGQTDAYLHAGVLEVEGVRVTL